METLQNLTDYKPTKMEENLIEVLLNPENRQKSITDICKLANCSRFTYYEAAKKPEFVRYLNEKVIELAKMAYAPIMNTFIREAIRGSHQHGQTVLEMIGAYTPNANVNLKADVGVKIVDDIK
jgi:hypothetical protein